MWPGTALPADVVVLDVDATIVIAHSEKEQATRTFKKTFGYHPLGVWCDNTGEFLAAKLRAGNAGSNTTADHLAVLKKAIAQVPAGHRKRLLVRADGAGASHGLLDWLTDLNTAPVHGRRGRSVQYSVGFAVTDAVRDAIALVPKSAWARALDADGDVREHADVVEVTELLPITLREAWPVGMRVIVRRNAARRRQASLAHLWHGAATQSGIAGTAWAAYQSVVEYVDHVAPVRDKSDAATARALRLLTTDEPARIKARAWTALAPA